MEETGHADVVLRAATLIVLGGVTFGLLVWYGRVAGRFAAVAGLVTSGAIGTSDVTSVAFGTASPPAVAATVRDLAAAAADGASISTVGAASDWRALAIRADWEERYMYGVSALAATWLWLRLLRDWRFEVRSLRLVPRSTEDDRDA